MPQTKAQTKKDLRLDAKRIRAGAHAMNAVGAAEQATTHAMNLFGGMDRENIFGLYMPMGDELDARFLMLALSNAGFRTALPVTVKDAPLTFRLWAQGDPLESGPMGTLHPVTDAPEIIPDVFIIPLLAFDRDCYRLGWGGGYYDRTLAKFHSGRKAFGLAYAAQYVDALPRDDHDWPLHGVLTEEGLILPQE